MPMNSYSTRGDASMRLLLKPLALLGWLPFMVCAVQAADPPPAPTYPAAIDCTKELVRMDRCQLLDLYQRAEPGPVPCGYAPGRNIPNPGHRSTAMRSALARMTVWQGKYFEPDGFMVNRMFGVKTNKAQIYYGESWLDGKPSLILDYEETSRMWSQYRDELREVSPGIYLGIMYQRKCPEPKIKTFFAIDARSGTCCCR
jgi:hypothetical protein